MNMMRRIFCVIWILGVLAIYSGCEEPHPTGDMVDQTLVGKWTLAKEETLRRQNKEFRDSGVFETNQDRFDFEAGFTSVYFDIEMTSDALWTCQMGDFFSSGNFNGYWLTEGNEVRLVQTHEGEKKKSDKMEGTYDDDHLYVTHRVTTGGGELSIPYVFNRVR